MKLAKLLVAGLIASLSASAGWAQGWASSDYDFASRQLDDFITGHQRDLVNPVLRGVRKQQGRPPARVARTTTVVPQRTPQVPQAMAAKYPPADRSRMEQVFRRLLTGYQQIEQQQGVPRGDLAGAVAAFLAFSYVAYRDEDLPDEYFAPLVEQMRSILATDPAISGASTAARQEMYEQLAITGMFMATMRMALKQQPNAAAAERVRAMGKNSLEQFLQTDAQRVKFTTQGVVLR
jgi:hypothetical protein